MNSKFKIIRWKVPYTIASFKQISVTENNDWGEGELGTFLDRQRGSLKVPLENGEHKE